MCILCVETIQVLLIPELTIFPVRCIFIKIQGTENYVIQRLHSKRIYHNSTQCDYVQLYRWLV